MEKLCGRVRPEDGPALERLVQPIRDRASAAAQDFLLLHSNPAPLPQAPRPPGHSSSGGSHGDDVGREPPPVNQTQLLLPVIPLNESAAESWDTLEEDLKELSGLVTEFSLLVHVSMLCTVHIEKYSPWLFPHFVTLEPNSKMY
eukprot:XP_014041716.1 PREDICTED: syntaxin-17-like [Salmo salar]